MIPQGPVGTAETPQAKEIGQEQRPKNPKRGTSIGISMKEKACCSRGFIFGYFQNLSF